MSHLNLQLGKVKTHTYTKLSIIITLVGLVMVRVPLAFIFYSLGLPIEWIYATLIADYFLKGMLLAYRYKSRKWMKVLKMDN